MHLHGSTQSPPCTSSLWTPKPALDRPLLNLNPSFYLFVPDSLLNMFLNISCIDLIDYFQFFYKHYVSVPNKLGLAIWILTSLFKLIPYLHHTKNELLFFEQVKMSFIEHISLVSYLYLSLHWYQTLKSTYHVRLDEKQVSMEGKVTVMLQVPIMNIFHAEGRPNSLNLTQTRKAPFLLSVQFG